MSLINKMLQDLEKRQAKRRDNDGKDFASGLNSVDDYEDKKGFSGKRKYIYLGIFVVLLAAILINRSFKKSPASPQDVAQQTTPAQTQQTQVVNPFADASGQAPASQQDTTPQSKTAPKPEEKSADKAGAVMSTSKKQPADEATTADATESIETEEVVESPPIAPVTELEKISISPVSREKQKVTFYFNTGFKYEFNTNEEGDELNFVFENTKVPPDILPKLESNSYIKEIGYLRELDFEKFIFYIEEGVSVAGLETEKTGFPQKLVLNLSGAAVKKPEATVAEPPVETFAPDTGEVYKVARPPTPKEQMQLDYEDAIKDLDANRFGLAMGKLATILKKHPGNLQVRSDLMTLYFEQEDYIAVQHLLGDGLVINSSYPPFVMMKARLLIVSGDTQGAINVLSAIKPDIKEYPDFYATLAQLEQQQENFQVAAQLYLELIRLEPTQGRWWLGYGLALEGLGKRNVAIQAYEKAVATGTLPYELQAFAKGRIDALGS